MIEVVNGTVIGEFTWPYRFYTLDGKRITSTQDFATDAEAIAWFKEHYPEEYKRGAEMRRYE